MKAPTEAECQRTIIEAARLGGWLVHHSRPAQMQSGRWATPIQGDVGFPDLVLVRGSRMIAVELKRKPNNPTPAQWKWINGLLDAGIDVRLLWVPENMDTFIAELTTPRGSDAAA